jgi:glutaconate CoA-transferase, subunit A
VILSALQAGASGVAFAQVPGLIGSDILRYRTDYRVIENPFDAGRRVVVVPAINPDVALVHALRADREGNIVVPAAGDTPMLAMASRYVIVTAEEISEGPITSVGADERFIPGIYVHAIAPAPQGAHPLRCPGLYDTDQDHLRRYVAASRDPELFAAYLREYVQEPEDEAEYLSRALSEAARA